MRVCLGEGMVLEVEGQANDRVASMKLCVGGGCEEERDWTYERTLTRGM